MQAQLLLVQICLLINLSPLLCCLVRPLIRLRIRLVGIWQIALWTQIRLDQICYCINLARLLYCLVGPLMTLQFHLVVPWTLQQYQVEQTPFRTDAWVWGWVIRAAHGMVMRSLMS